MGQANTSSWRGHPEIQFEYNGASSDPSLIWQGYVFNLYDIEDALWEEFLEERGLSDNASGDPAVEQEFDEYLADKAVGYLEDCVDGGCFQERQKDWRD